MKNPSRFSRALFIFLLAGLTLSGAFGCGSEGVPLTVVVNGAGRVISKPQGIYCGPVCGSFFLAGTNVVLTASAFQGSSFTGWSGGGCSGTSTCTINLQQATTVTANFGGTPLSVSVTGIGSVGVHHPDVSDVVGGLRGASIEIARREKGDLIAIRGETRKETVDPRHGYPGERVGIAAIGIHQPNIHRRRNGRSIQRRI